MTMPEEMKKLRERLSHEYSRGLSGVCQSDFSLGFNAAYAAMAERERELREALSDALYWIPCGHEIGHQDAEMTTRLIHDRERMLALLAQRKEGDGE